jgi:hypothetical protein
MSFEFGEPQDTLDDVVSLAQHVRVRVLNCSAAGCLLETTAPVSVGASGRLRVSLGGRHFDDTIQVVRCEHIKGTGSVHHVATKFISTTPPYAGSLRYSMRRGAIDLAGWLDTNKDQ